jgi:hypothetical protein
LRFIERYQPAAGAVPAFSDGAGPPLLVEMNFETLDDAAGVIGLSVCRDALALPRRVTGRSAEAAIDVFHAVHFPLPGHAEPPPRAAPLSFVVRYYRPVADEYAFAEFYTAHHPPLLARFPGIRNVLCYLPAGFRLPADMQSTGAFLGNEVVFDDLASLNRALASDVLPLLKADGRRFAPFGHNSHHAMLRTVLYERTA